MNLRVLLPVMMLGGCALWPWSGPGAPPPLAAKVDTVPASARQILMLEYKEQTLQLQCEFSSSGPGWRLACINAAGLRLLSLQVDSAQQVRANWAPGIPDSIDARQIAFDLQFALWPFAELKTALGGSSWSLAQSAAGRRELRYRGRPVAVAQVSSDPWNDQVSIEHLRIGYRLQVQTHAAPHAH